MWTCKHCNSDRIASISAKCGDLCFVQIKDYTQDYYVPHDMGIGGGDNVRFSFCLDCGQIRGQFPLEKTEIEQRGSE